MLLILYHEALNDNESKRDIYKYLCFETMLLFRLCDLLESTNFDTDTDTIYVICEKLKTQTW